MNSVKRKRMNRILVIVLSCVLTVMVIGCKPKRESTRVAEPARVNPDQKISAQQFLAELRAKPHEERKAFVNHRRAGIAAVMESQDQRLIDEFHLLMSGGEETP